ncbi:PQQ-dependent sugar dehydrogenase [Gordonia phosphorivorans]|uniref:PQQ-dependent sugar dehydrogenase n=1 Tax=Gordonia phosphorivorans TaxID=1056982 RepID=A0ABV6H9Q3_9ACTN
MGTGNRIRWALSLLTLSLVAGCTAEDTALPGAATVEAGATVVTSRLDAPWSIAFYGDTPLVSERDSGRILEVDDTGGTREVARIDGVLARGEAGLLGLAVRGDELYAYYSTDTDNRIERFDIEGSAGGLSLSGGDIVFDGIPVAINHNGGRLAFGPDGLLYATTGDAARPESAQDPDSLSGKILQIQPAQAGAPARTRVYSMGHRNSQGLAWTPDGTMFAAEFGQDTWDELNVIVEGGNYGWPVVEGIAGREGFIDPVQQWTPGQASPSGIAFHDGVIAIANLRGQRLRTVATSAPWTTTDTLAGAGRLRDVVVAPDGTLWVLTNNTDGRGRPSGSDDRILRVQLSPDAAEPSR